MTIVHIIEPFASGVTTAVINITKTLPEMDHVVIHGTRTWVDSIENVRKKFPDYVQFEQWKYAQREIRPLKDFKALLNLISILRRYRNSVVHLHSSKAGFLGRLAARLAGIKSILYTPHCAAFIRTDISEKKKQLYIRLERIASNFGGKVVGCGRSEAELYRKIGIDASFVANGTNPINIEKNPKATMVGFVAIANDQKNPRLFNRIAALLEPEGIQFVWIGEGVLQEELRASNITLTGWVEKRKIEKYFSDMLVYLSTANWEGLPYGVLEAMSASTALLLHDVPGNRELVEAGRNGYLFATAEEAAEKLRLMLADRHAALEMGRQSRQMFEKHYQLEHMGRAYGEIYRTLCKM